MRSTKPYVLVAYLGAIAISTVRELAPRLWRKVFGAPFEGAQAFDLDDEVKTQSDDPLLPQFSRRTGLIRRNRLKRRYYTSRTDAARRIEPKETDQ